MLEQQRSYVRNYFARRARAPPHARALACSKSSQVKSSRLQCFSPSCHAACAPTHAANGGPDPLRAFWSSCSTRREHGARDKNGEEFVGLFT